MAKKRKSFNYQQIILALIAVIIIIAIFGFFDFLAHSTSEKYNVPDYYFRNKIIYGTLIGFITWFFIKNKPIIEKALIFSAVVSILLQIRYYLEGYALSFVILFLFIHFIILTIVSSMIFWLLRKNI